MITSLKSLITGTPQGKAVKLKFTRPAHVGGVCHEAGSVGTFSESEAAQLLAAGCCFDPTAADTAEARMQRLNAMLPPPFEPQPLPESWRKLPKCFAVWWETNEQLQCLHRRHMAIEAKLLELVSRHVYTPGNLDLGGNIADPFQRSRALQAAFASFKVGGIDPEEAETIRHLKDANHRAELAVRDWRESPAQSELLKAKFECSAHCIEAHGRVSHFVRELAEVGRQIFAERVSALGLSDWKIRELFSGSADAVKFVFPEPSLTNLKLGWYQPDVGPVYYLETPVPVLIGIVERWEADAARFQKLLAEGEKELSKAQKAA